jgi:probable F420-dependent oxidoreductase
LKFWIAFSFTDPTHMVPLARRAEELGFEGVFLADHLAYPAEFQSKYPYSVAGEPPFDAATPFPDPFACITAMATATRRLRFSIAIYILPLHDPLYVAKACATTSILSGGRFSLGAGAGWMREEFALRGLDFESRGKRMDESIDVMRKLWSGQMVEHRGRCFAFPRLCQSPPPPAPVPILIGGASPAALRRAGRLGDGWIGAGNTPEQAEEILRSLARHRHEAGRRGPFEAIVPLVTPPDAGVYARLAALGMSASVSWPPSLAMGISKPSLEQELAYLEQFGRDVMRPFASAG